MSIPRRLRSIRLRHLAVLWFIGAGALAVVILVLPVQFGLPLGVFAVLVASLGAFLFLERRVRGLRNGRPASDPKAQQRLKDIQNSVWGRKKQLSAVREQLRRLKRSQDRMLRKLDSAPSAAAHDEELGRRIDDLSARVDAIADAPALRDLATTSALLLERITVIEAERVAERIRAESGATAVPLAEEVALVRSSALFDAEWYRSRLSGPVADPAEHYVTVGTFLGLPPHPMFDPDWYLGRNPAALVRYRSPLGHLMSGSPDVVADVHPAFDEAWYSSAFLDSGSEVPAVLHYLLGGEAAGCDPNRLFDAAWYRVQYGDRLPAGENAFVHYLSHGAAAGLHPHPRFDPETIGRSIPAGAKDLISRAVLRQRELEQQAWPLPERPSEADWQWYDLCTGKHAEPDTFALYRIIGNDLPPRHSADQTLRNLEFMLRHEPELADCRKIWVLNRIIDAEQELRLKALLDRYAAEYIAIPFDVEEYRRLAWNFERLGADATFTTEFQSRYAGPSFEKALEHLYHDKNRYVMNNNAARNFALQHGRGLAKWVLPWDGNCFLTEAAWKELRDAVAERSHLRYVIVPMARLTAENETLLEPDLDLKALDEPQIAFRDDARAEFHPDFRYGHRPKVELLRRLGVPGEWDGFKAMPWDLPFTTDESEQHAWGLASRVYRLYSGSIVQELDSGQRRRGRHDAIRSHIDRIDESLARQTFDAAAPQILDSSALRDQVDRFRRGGDAALEAVVGELVARAETLLEEPVVSVFDKRTTAPSGDRHDYWIPADNWWPDPSSDDGLPYLHDETRRVPGTRVGDDGSDQYDRKALQHMIEGVYISALAGSFTGDRRFSLRAAEQLRAWFTDPATRMSPHLEYAQVRLGHNGNHSYSLAVTETTCFYYLLDAIRLVEREGGIDAATLIGVKTWFREFRLWLEDSPQGRGAAGRSDGAGLWFDLQVAAIDAYLDDVVGLQATMRRVFERVGRQFDPRDGALKMETGAEDSQRNSVDLATGWLALSRVAAGLGLDLVGFEHPSGASLAKGLEWLASRMGQPWPYLQERKFDADRFGIVSLWSGRSNQMQALARRQRFKDGVTPPFWALGAEATGTGDTVAQRVAPVVLAAAGPARTGADAGDFLHVVLTRFNIGAFNERWLSYRQELFETLTLPSLDGQTERNFLWALAINPDTPPKFRERLDELVESRPYLRLVEVELFEEFRSTLARWCRKEARGVGASHLLSTRIDTDDVLHRDLFARLHHDAREILAEGRRLPAVLTPTSGYRWVPATGSGHTAYDNCPSTGTSMLEPVKGFQSVYKVNHRTLPNWATRQDGSITAIDGDAHWWMHATTDASLTRLWLGDQRRDSTMAHPTVRELDDEVLRQFGVTDAARLRVIEEPAFVENYQEIMERIGELDKQIKATRDELREQRKAVGDESPELLARLEQIRGERRKHSESLMD